MGGRHDPVQRAVPCGSVILIPSEVELNCAAWAAGIEETKPTVDIAMT